jgi:hypothetical protein
MTSGTREDRSGYARTAVSGPRASSPTQGTPALSPASVSAILDPAEAAVLRQSLESGYRHALDAAMRAWTPGERSARLALAGELGLLAGAEQASAAAGAAAEGSADWRSSRHAARYRSADRDLELEAGA